jgi:hypothetical protein
VSGFRIASVLAVIVLAPGAWAHAQGLGDTAKKEKQKRTQTAKKEPAKVFTNEDLDAGRPPGAKKASEDASGTSAPASQEASSAPSEPSRLEQERPYIEAIQGAEGEVKAAEGRVKELQAKLNPMSTTFIYGSGGSGDANEEQRVRGELRQAEDQLQAARQQVVQANQNLQDFRQGRAPREER